MPLSFCPRCRNWWKIFGNNHSQEPGMFCEKFILMNNWRLLAFNFFFMHVRVLLKYMKFQIWITQLRTLSCWCNIFVGISLLFSLFWIIFGWGGYTTSFLLCSLCMFGCVKMCLNLEVVWSFACLMKYLDWSCVFVF